jgi:enoyl-CoA hydratase/carnithine racemase
MTAPDATAADAARELTLDRDGAVATVAIRREHEDNRLARAHLARLGEIAAEIAADDGIHAVVITGAGAGWFSAGLLNPEIRAALPKEDVLEVVRLANRVFDAVEALPQIVVCAINGAVTAGAVELALACDIRLASAASFMACPEALWGGFPGAGAPVRLPLVVGYGRAMELIATGRRIDAGEMERLGFVEKLCADAEATRMEAHDLARKIAASGPLATRGAKSIAKTRLAAGFAEARALSDELRRALEYSADVDEGIRAHKEGRTPRFTGR